MFTVDDIIQLRLEISDPADVISIVALLDKTELPAIPEPQTAYRVDGVYYSTDKTEDATEADYEPLELQISDTMLYRLLEIGNAPCRALTMISRRLGGSLRIVRSQSGAESTEYARAYDLYLYYKALADDCKEQAKSDAGTNTGRYGLTAGVYIAGGDL